MVTCIVNKNIRISHVTLLAPTCRKACVHCGYPSYSDIDFDKIKHIARRLMSGGISISFYDMNPSEESLAVYELIGQYSDDHSFGWLNITPDFTLSEVAEKTFRKMKAGLCISLHGSTAKVHSIISPNLDFNASLAKYEEMKIRFPEKSIGFAMVVHKQNINDIPNYFELANKRKVDYVEFINLLPTGAARYGMDKELFLDGTAKTKALRLISETNYKSLVTLLDSTWGPVPASYRIPPIPGYDPNACSMFAPAIKGFFCNAGFNHLAIRVDTMEVFPCPGMAVWPELCVGMFSPVEGFRIKSGHFFWDQVEQGIACSTCSVYASCRGGCSITAYCEAALSLGESLRSRVTQDDCCRSLSKEF